MESELTGLGRDRVIHLARERPFRLGAVEVRPATREVISPQGRLVLEPRVMQVLVALARAGGEVVTREDLTESCWEGRIVGEDAISRVISHLRRVSEGVGRDGWTLETVTKVGYRLVPVGADATQVVEPGRPAPAVPRRWLLAAGGGAAVLAGAAVWWTRRPAPASSQAQALYDKGREALRQGSAEQVAQAVGFLRAAVAEAPQHAPSWGALALAYQASLNFTDAARQAGVRAQAEVAARRALELDGNEPDGAAALALLAPLYRNWQAAELLYDRALRLHPHQPLLQGFYSQLMLGVGRVRLSVTAAQAALAADSFAPLNHHVVARSLWSAGRTEEAEMILRKALGLWPEHYALWFLRFNLLAHTGRADQAVAIAQDVANRPISIPAADVELSVLAARAMASRKPADIARAVAEHMTAARKGAGYAEGAIGWLCGLGRLDEAFAVARGLYFGEGFSLGDQRYSPAQGRYMVSGRQRNTHNLFMPQVASARADPRFRILVRDIGITAYWQASGHPPDDASLLRPV